jgi:hypothetical protein
MDILEIYPGISWVIVGVSSLLVSFIMITFLDIAFESIDNIKKRFKKLKEK